MARKLTGFEQIQQRSKGQCPLVLDDVATAQVFPIDVIPTDVVRAAGAPLLYSFRLIPLIGKLVAHHGVDVKALLRDSGLPVEPQPKEVMAPLPQIRAFVTMAARATNKDLFGLELAAALPGGTFGITEFLVRTAPSVERGLMALCEFAALLNPLGVFRYERTASGGALRYAVGADAEGAGAHLNEFALAYIVNQLGASLGRSLTISEIWFSHSRTQGAMDVARYFGCTARFDAGDCGFTLAQDMLDLAPRSSDPLVFEFLEGQARSQLVRLVPTDVIGEIVRIVDANMEGGDVRVEATASVLGVSARTLQRSLVSVGTTYRAVLAHARRRRRSELQAQRFSETAIAHKLGFYDARAMRRSLDGTE